MLLLKGGAMLISFLYVPLLLESMNSVNYGIWLTLTSMVSWVSMLDIGLGNGLRNKLAESLAKGNEHLGKEYVSTAYVSIISLSSLLGLVFIASYQFINWVDVLNADGIDSAQLSNLVLVVFLSFCAQFSLSLINSILYALQMPALSSLIGLIGQLGAFIVVYILSKNGQNSLLLLGSVISIIPPIVLLTSSIILFGFKYKKISPSISCFDKSKVVSVLSIGIKFFILQIITIVLFQSNNIIITHTIGAEAVVEYNISYKYMSILVMLYSMIVMPLWSASTDAYFRNDFDWIKNTVKKMNKIIMLFILIGALMLIVSPFLYDFWLGENNVAISWTSTLCLYWYTVVMICYQTYGYIINGIGKLKIQMLITSIMALVYIPLAYILGNKYGLLGVLFVFASSATINFIWSKIQYTKLINGTASGVWDK